MPTNPRLLTLLTFSSFTLVACHSSPERGDARFRDLSPADRDEAIRTAAGMPVVMPYFVVFGAELDAADGAGCPARSESAGQVTYTGGCASADGTRYEGTLVARNVPLFDGTAVADDEMAITMDDFVVDGVRYDGTVSQSLAMPANGQRYTTAADFTLQNGAIAVSFEMDADCTQRPDGSECELDGFADAPIGSFGFDGEIAIGAESASGALELRGADTLRVDFDAAVEGCAPYTIDGDAAGEFCFAEPAPSDELEFTGGGGGCGGDGTTFTYDLDAWVRGDATRVTVTLVGVAAQEEHDLAWVSYDDANDENLWQTSFGEAETAFTCGEEITYQFTAYDAEGGSVTFEL